MGFAAISSTRRELARRYGELAVGAIIGAVAILPVLLRSESALPARPTPEAKNSAPPL